MARTDHMYRLNQLLQQVRERESLSVDWPAPAGLEKPAAGPSTVLHLDFSENYGDLRDFVQEYEDGRMTAEAKAIYEAILEPGPLDTMRLRREARISAESAKSRFDRALVELQVGLKALPIGVARTGEWNSPTNCSSAGSPRFPSRRVESSAARRGGCWCSATSTTSSPRTAR